MIRLKTYTNIRLLLFLLTVFISGIATNSCEKVKTYEEGPGFSLRSKMNRITGEWGLISYQADLEELNEDSLNYMKLILTQDAIDENIYKAKFISFKEVNCNVNYGPAIYYTSKGAWEFYEGAYGGCNINDDLKEKEGLRLKINNDTIPSGIWHTWKIMRLTNKELILQGMFCIEWCSPEGWSQRKLIFEKE